MLLGVGNLCLQILSSYLPHQAAVSPIYPSCPFWRTDQQSLQCVHLQKVFHCAVARVANIAPLKYSAGLAASVQGKRFISQPDDLSSEPVKLEIGTCFVLSRKGKVKEIWNSKPWPHFSSSKCCDIMHCQGSLQMDYPAIWLFPSPQYQPEKGLAGFHYGDE